MKRRVVIKFGGTSVGNAQRINGACDIIVEGIRNGYEIIVVSSAVSGITNKLVAFIDELTVGYDEKDTTIKALRFGKELENIHKDIASTCISDAAILKDVRGAIAEYCRKLERVALGVFFVGELSLKTTDQILAIGEMLSCPIIAGILKERGFASHFLTGGQAGITTDTRYGEAVPLMDICDEQIPHILNPLLQENIIPVITGYNGLSTEGRITTMGRGGSDFTASIIGSCMNAYEIWIMTDVDGIKTTDPRIAPQAVTIDSMTFGEAAELAYFGAKVLHPKTIMPAMKKGIPVRVKNSFNPHHPGTRITHDADISQPVRALTYIHDVLLLTISNTKTADISEATAEIFSRLAEKKITVFVISQGSSESQISLVIPAGKLSDAQSALKDLAHLTLDVQDGYSVVALVGSQLHGKTAVLARIFTVLAEHSIDIAMFTQSYQEVNITFMVEANKVKDTITILHDAFELEKSAGALAKLNV